MIKTKTVTFGTDAELFLRTLKGEPFPVCGLIGGTKKNPLPIPLGEGYAVQEDCAALEFNVPPFHSPSELADAVGRALVYIEKMIPSTLELNTDSCSEVFADQYLKIPQMVTFGCEPDQNAWTQTTNPRPSPEIPGHRSASAHVHIGWEQTEEDSDETVFELVRLFDVFVVLRSIEYQAKDEIERRTLYGRAGSFRKKSYGLEHRVLSNRWITKRRDLLSTIRQYIRAINAFNGGVRVEKSDYSDITHTINKGVVDRAHILYSKYMGKLHAQLGDEKEERLYLQDFYMRSKSGSISALAVETLS